jgi:ATP-dependent protease ClpP protease subunit
MDKFIARYTDEKGIIRSFSFNKSQFNEERAEEYLNKKGIQNFLFFFEPNEPTQFGENGIHFKGEVGFDITMDNLMPYVDAGKEIILDSFGGDLFEGWKIHDAIKLSGKNPKITILGTCASSCMQILLSSDNREMTPQSRLLIHNPWTYEVGDDEQMQRVANDLKVEKDRLAKFYSNISGKSNDEILAIMKEERFMHIDESIEMNFVNNENVEIKESEEMNAEQEKTLNSISEGLKNLKNLFVKPVKNVLVQDVNGTEIKFDDKVETVEQISVGDEATVDGSPANDEYVMSDGTVNVFEKGILTEIKEPESQEETENNALQEENEELKNSIVEKDKLLNDLKASIVEKDKLLNDLKAKSDEFESKYNELSNQFNEFKNRFSDEKEEIKVPEEKEKQSGGLKFNKNKLRNGY